MRRINGATAMKNIYGTFASRSECTSGYSIGKNADLLELLRLNVSLWRERDMLSRSTFKNRYPKHHQCFGYHVELSEARS